MEWLWNTLICLGLVVVTGVGIFLFQRSLGKPGGRDGMGGMAAGFGAMNSVFSPTTQEALLEIQEQQRRILPSPVAADGPHGLKISADDDGVPTRAVISRDAGGGDPAGGTGFPSDPRFPPSAQPADGL